MDKYVCEPDEQDESGGEGQTFADGGGRRGACEVRIRAGGRAAQHLSDRGKRIDVVDIARGEFAKDEHEAGRPDPTRIKRKGEESDLEDEGVLEDRDPGGKDTQKRQEENHRLAGPTSRDVTKDQGWGRGGGGTLRGEALLAEQSGGIHLGSNPLHGRRKRDEEFVESFGENKNKGEVKAVAEERRTRSPEKRDR